MSDPDAPLNPYAPSLVAQEDRRAIDQAMAGNHQESEPEAEPVPLPLWRTSLRWLLVCSISAAPSFAFGLITTNGRIAGMLLGILIFVIGYTWIDFRTAGRPWRRRKRIRRTLRLVYGTRLAISIVFPVGAYLDLFCGLLSVTITEPITRMDLSGHNSSGADGMDFLGALVTTLVQGGVLNVVLGIYGVLLLLAQLLYARLIR